MVLLQADTAVAAADVKEVKEDFRALAARAFGEAGQEVASLFRDSWLSGRGAGGLGLNIVTGRLHQSVRSATTVRAKSVTSEVLNRGAGYWWYHEHPENGRHRFLYLEDAFEEDGGRIYTEAVERAMESIA